MIWRCAARLITGPRSKGATEVYEPSNSAAEASFLPPVPRHKRLRHLPCRLRISCSSPPRRYVSRPFIFTVIFPPLRRFATQRGFAAPRVRRFTPAAFTPSIVASLSRVFPARVMLPAVSCPSFFAQRRDAAMPRARVKRHDGGTRPPGGVAAYRLPPSLSSGRQRRRAKGRCVQVGVNARR